MSSTYNIDGCCPISAWEVHTAPSSPLWTSLLYPKWTMLSKLLLQIIQKQKPLIPPHLWIIQPCHITLVFSLPNHHMSATRRHPYLHLMASPIYCWNLLLPQLFHTAPTSQLTLVYRTVTSWLLYFLVQTNSSTAMYATLHALFSEWHVF